MIRRRNGARQRLFAALVHYVPAVAGHFTASRIQETTSPMDGRKCADGMSCTNAQTQDESELGSPGS